MDADNQCGGAMYFVFVLSKMPCLVLLLLVCCSLAF